MLAFRVQILTFNEVLSVNIIQHFPLKLSLCAFLATSELIGEVQGQELRSVPSLEYVGSAVHPGLPHLASPILRNNTVGLTLVFMNVFSAT